MILQGNDSCIIINRNHIDIDDEGDCYSVDDLLLSFSDGCKNLGDITVSADLCGCYATFNFIESCETIYLPIGWVTFSISQNDECIYKGREFVQFQKTISLNSCQE